MADVAAPPPAKATIATVNAHPVKGCKPITLELALLTSTGTASTISSCSSQIEQRRGLMAHQIFPTQGSFAPRLAAGLPYDRDWMVCRESDGKFISQRERPKLTLVRWAVRGHTPALAASAQPETQTLKAPRLVLLYSAGATSHRC